MKIETFAAGLVVGALMASTAAQAQSSRGPLFLSPMGEPFRGDGEALPIRTWFAAADQNADGLLSRDEFVAQALTFFANTLDTNQDGAATSLESSALWREQAPELAASRPSPAAQPRAPHQPDSRSRDPRARRQTRGDQQPEAPPSPMAHFALFDIAEPVMSCDVDMSRRVTAAEFEACAARRFAQMDANGDGAFTLEENARAAALATPRAQ